MLTLQEKAVIQAKRNEGNNTEADALTVANTFSYKDVYDLDLQSNTKKITDDNKQIAIYNQNK